MAAKEKVLRSGTWTDQAALSMRVERIVDLSGLDFIDSTGLGALVQAHRSDREDGNRLRFLRGSAPVQRVMELTCLDRSLPFAD